jgi:FtsZ-binding cell division protein ZapB
MSQEILTTLEKKIATAIERIQTLNLKVQQLESENIVLKTEVQFYYDHIQKLLNQDQSPLME